jgi:hypothetical protein
VETELQKGVPVYVIVATGAAVIVTFVEAVTGVHVPATIVYVTVYEPGVLVIGVTDPVMELIVSPAGEALNVPPLVPVNVTLCDDESDWQ